MPPEANPPWIGSIRRRTFMSETVFTFPGKAGDAVLQFPVAYQWHRKTGKNFTCWLDEKTCKIVAPLFEAQPCVNRVEFMEGVEHHHWGGQPWDFALPAEAYSGREVHHLGPRAFPQRQITLETLENIKLPFEIDREALASEPCISVDREPANRVVLHGQPVCIHNGQTPQFWSFLHAISPWLESNFDEIVWVGDARDREMGARTYPGWKCFDDHGSALELARLIARSRLMIGCGSFPVTVGGALKIPTVRVHDPIGNHPKVIWNNLGDNQLNDSEMELRTAWPEFRDRFLVK